MVFKLTKPLTSVLYLVLAYSGPYFMNFKSILRNLPKCSDIYHWYLYVLCDSSNFYRFYFKVEVSIEKSFTETCPENDLQLHPESLHLVDPL